MIYWLYLGIAIVAEVFGTVSLKLSNGFEVVGYVISTAVCYTLSFWLLALALKGIELSMAYAVWAGVGTAVVAIVGIAIFHESLNVIKVLSILAIVTGVVGLHLADKSIAA